MILTLHENVKIKYEKLMKIQRSMTKPLGLIKDCMGLSLLG